MKNIVLCNLQNSGSSALDPILPDFLQERGYKVLSLEEVSPADDSKLINYLEAPEKIYCWVHVPSSEVDFKRYEAILQRKDTILLLLHRDPRDAMVSMMHDIVSRNKHIEFDQKELIKDLCTKVFPSRLEYTSKLLNSNSQSLVEITFTELKNNPMSVIQNILEQAQVDNDQISLQSYLDKYSFENQTNGVKRGSSNTTVVRTAYMFRKGIDGDWKNYFNSEIEEIYKNMHSNYHINLGYIL